MSFDRLHVLEDVSFEVPPGERFGIIGPNGAGKSVLLNTMFGINRPTSGSVVYDERDVTSLPPHVIAAERVARTFQMVEYFKDFTTLEYVRLSRLEHEELGLWRCGLRLPGVRRRAREELAVAWEALERFGIANLAHKALRSLPYGMQKVIDVVRAVATAPRLLLLDEPTTGTGAAERARLSELLADERLADTTVVVVDHDVSFVAGACGRLMALSVGRVVAIDAPSKILEHPEVIDAYIGNEA